MGFVLFEEKHCGEQEIKIILKWISLNDESEI
jgi:hypothetical protein